LASLAYWAFASLHPALRALGSAPLASKLALGFKSPIYAKQKGHQRCPFCLAEKEGFAR